MTLRQWKKKYKLESIIANVGIYFFLLVLSVIVLFPIYYFVINTFKSKLEFAENSVGFPLVWTISSLVQAWTAGNFGVALKNSVLLTVIGVLTRLLLGTLAAYAFAVMEFGAKRLLYFTIISSMFVAPMMLVIPLYLQMSVLGLLDTYSGLIIIYTGLIAFTIYVLTAYFKGIPRELFDAAKIDGCSDFGIYYRIVLPMSKPVLATLTVINAMMIWNDLVFPLLFLTRKETWTLMVALASFQIGFSRYVDMTMIMGGLFIASLPIIAIYLFSQKYFVKGMTLGALK